MTSWKACLCRYRQPMSKEWEEELRVFFGRFLIGHLATDHDMDGYLGFTPPETLALHNSYP
jgi:hypothetical protein